MGQIARIAVLTVFGAGVGVATNQLGSAGIDLDRPIFVAADAGAAECAPNDGEIQTVNIDTAKALCGDCRAAFVDARGGASYAAGHILNAVHLPPADHPRSAHVEKTLRDAEIVIVYGDNGSCDRAVSVASHLRAAGHLDVRILEGGWPVWARKEGPSVSGACDTCDAE